MNFGQEQIETPISKAAPALKPPRGSASVHLDALRGFAAFSVLLYHWHSALLLGQPGHFLHNPLQWIGFVATSIGPLWVKVFFVMSGYLVGGSVLRAVDSGRWSWRGYMFTRLTRLYIVLLPALLLGGLVDWTGMHLAHTESVYIEHVDVGGSLENVQTTLTLPALTANCLFLQTVKLPWMHGDSLPPFGTNGPLWSLCNEFWYYMAFPPLVLLLARARPWWLRAVYGLGLLAWTWFVGREIALLGIPWLMGVGILYLPPFPARRLWTRRLAMAAALALFAAGIWLNLNMPTLFADLAFALAVTILIWVTLHCATTPMPALYVRIAQRSARSSYTLYLVHMPLLILLKASLHLPRAYLSWHVLIVSVGLLLAIVLYAQLVYQLFERNTDRMRKWLEPYVMGRKAAHSAAK